MNTLNDLVTILQNCNYSVTDIMETKNGINITIFPDKKEELFINSAPNDVDFDRVDEIMTHECYPRMFATVDYNMKSEEGNDCDEDSKK